VGEVEEEGFLLFDGFVDEFDALAGPELGAVLWRVELGVIKGDFVAVEKEWRASLGAGLVAEVNAAGGQVEAAVKASVPWVDALVGADVPLACHGGEVARLSEDFGNGDAVIAEATLVARVVLVLLVIQPTPAWWE